MLGAIFGDIAGSVYERYNTHDYNFRLLSRRSRPTDDSYMTLAVAKALVETYGQEDDVIRAALVRNMQEIGNNHPYAGYGSKFRVWLQDRGTEPYYSCGNGSAMRVSPAGWLYRTLDETLHAAKLTAEVTHNHPEGIKGAQAIAAAIFLARAGAQKEEIINYIANTFDYNLFRRLDTIRETYTFHADCQRSVPEAVIAFYESENYEDAIRKAVSLGGDSDTIASMAGAIAEAFYGMPGRYRKEALKRLDPEMQTIAADFRSFYRKHSGKPLDGWQEEIRVHHADEPYLRYNAALEEKIDLFYQEAAAADEGKKVEGPNPLPVLEAVLACMQLGGHVLIPVKMPDKFMEQFDPEKIQKGDTITTEEDEYFTLVHLTDENGNIAMPVFTGEEKMREFYAEGLSVLSNFLDVYMQQVLQMEGVDAIVINPGPGHFILRKDVIKILLKQMEGPRVKKWTAGSSTYMMVPENVPEGFTDLFAEFAKNNLPSVDNIWLVGLNHEGEKSWCLAVRADREDDEGMEQIYQKLESFRLLLDLPVPLDYMRVPGCPWEKAIPVYSSYAAGEKE